MLGVLQNTQRCDFDRICLAIYFLLLLDLALWLQHPKEIQIGIKEGHNDTQVPFKLKGYKIRLQGSTYR